MPPTLCTAIVTDSTVSLPTHLARALHIFVVPMQVTLNDQSFSDGVDIMPGELYRAERQRNVVPRTSTPNPGSFLKAFEEAAAVAIGIVCITISHRYSAVGDAAKTAAELFRPEHPNTELRLVDSGTAAGAQAALVVAAARQIQPSTSAEEAEAIINRLKARSFMLATLDSLYYVARGGHVPRVAAWAGDLLRVKPILEMAPGGEVHQLERPRTRRRAVERMLQLAQQSIGDQPVLLNVIHADVLEEAERLKDRASQLFLSTETLVTEFSPVIGAHTGPGLLGLAYCIQPGM